MKEDIKTVAWGCLLLIVCGISLYYAVLNYYTGNVGLAIVLWAINSVACTLCIRTLVQFNKRVADDA